MTSAPEHGLDKLLWTDADFHRMGWHDSSIHAFHSGHRPERGEFDFLIDLDYIVRWEIPSLPRRAFPSGSLPRRSYSMVYTRSVLTSVPVMARSASTDSAG